MPYASCSRTVTRCTARVDTHRWPRPGVSPPAAPLYAGATWRLNGLYGSALSVGGSMGRAVVLESRAVAAGVRCAVQPSQTKAFTMHRWRAEVLAALH